MPENLRLKGFWSRLINYLKILVFLVAVLIVWFLLGLTATHAFPTDLAWNLICYLFVGFRQNNWKVSDGIEESLNSTWKEIKSVIDKFPESSKHNESVGKEKTRRLNLLDSEYWLIIRAIELLSSEIETSSKGTINWKLYELDQQRRLILEELEPLKKRHYKVLSNLQEKIGDPSKIITFESLLKNKEYDEISELLGKMENKLSENYSINQIPEVIEELSEKIYEKPRSRMLRQILSLLGMTYEMMSVQEGNRNDDSENTNFPEYAKFPIRARYGRQSYHISRRCHLYPKIEKSQDVENLRLFETSEKAEEEHLKICGICAKLENFNGHEFDSRGR